MKKKERLLPLYAFFLTLLVFLLFLGVYRVLGFGNFTILRGDLYAQYIDFISLFLKVLRGEESYWYSFSIYFGSGTALTYAYYTLSPFNLLYLLDFVPVPMMTAVIITVKISLAAATFTFFSQKVLKRNDLWVLFFALCYACNSFVISLHFNIIWLDAVFMVPVIVTLLVSTVRKKTFFPLCFAWFYLFVTNFYMSFMVGVFATVILFCLLLLHFEHFDKKTLKQCVPILIRFVGSVALAAGMSAAVLFPAAFYLLSHMAEDNVAFETLDTSIPAIINSMFLGQLPDLDNRLPLLYCGLPVLLLFPLYFRKSVFSKKERLVAGGLLLFYIFSMLILPLYIFMHAFDFPNWYGYRFSYMICFIFCVLAMRVFPVLEKKDLRFLTVWSVILLLLYSVMIAFGPLLTVSWNKMNSMDEFGINFIFITLWCTLAFLYFGKASFFAQKHGHKLVLRLALFSVLITELVTNGYVCMKGLGTTPISEQEFSQWYTPINDAVTSIQEKDGDLYRISIFNDSCQCSPCMFGYAGFNTFSSSDNYSLRQALHGLGIVTSNRSIVENGYSDISYMLFGGKYRIYLPMEDDLTSPEEPYYTKLPYALPIGYMVRPEIYDYAATDNPFDNQETLLKAMTGHPYHFYEPINIKDLNLLSANATFENTNEYNIFSRRTELGGTGYVTFAAPCKENKDYFACFTVDLATADSYSALVVGAANGFHETTAMSYGAIVKGTEYYGGVKNGFLNISVYLPEETSDYVCRNMYFVYYDDSELSDVYEDLSQGNWQIHSWFSDRIEASVTATEDRNVLFTSIPCENGWSAQVDGTPYPLSSTMDEAFLALDLTPGTHEIVLTYTAPGQKLGALASVCSFVALLLLTVILRALQKRSIK